MTDNVLYRDGPNVVIQGYGCIVVSWQCKNRLKLVLTHSPHAPLYYDIPNDGTETTVPLAYGYGQYRFNLVRRVYDSWATVADFMLADTAKWSSFSSTAFLDQTAWCNFTYFGPCARIVQKLGEPECDDDEYVNRVKKWIRTNLKFDHEKAKKLAGGHGYVPNPDDTVTVGSGVCSDISSAMVAMLRLRGIRARIATGYLKPEMSSHAWVEYSVFSTEKQQWVRYDPSMSLRTKRAKTVEHEYQTVCLW